MKQLKNNSHILGNIYPSSGQAGNVYSIHGIAPCLPGFGGGDGGKELKIIVKERVGVHEQE